MPTSDPYPSRRRRPTLRLIATTLGLVSALAVAAGAAQVEAPAAGGEPVAARGPAAAPTPFVVAVDTSRSLRPAELDSAVAAIRRALAALPADAPAGLLAFDDSPRWVRPVGTRPAEVSRALDELVLGGRFTLLHDALFAAVRALPDGGVVLVATDGRDENSATTVEDIARRCEEQGVRLLTLGAGSPVEERGLRRLALISDGAYLGGDAEAEPAALVEAVTRAREGVAEERLAARAMAAEAARAAGGDSGRPEAGGPAAGADGRRGAGGEAGRPGAAGGRTGSQGGLLGVPWWLIAALIVLLALALSALLLAARLRSAREAATVAEAEREVAAAAAARRNETRPIPASLVDTLTSRAAAPAGSAEEVSVDTAVFGGGSNGDATLDQTRVLAQRALLTIKEPGEGPPRTYLLRTDAAFAIGRDRRRNTLAVPDPALSSQHFKIVPDDGRFFLLDLRSTNGTFVNGERAQVHELESGDLIHAGQLECGFRSFAQAMG